ncbi:glutamine synthetase family protein [Sulfobacillus thermosulfidooxidans]|uniref:glutamine synthetase family protein n=1 Tax=Sulfobacillus thermosulfidooxidans TaxID=28034 RepID=UPI0002DBCBB9|nr:glutamine synthetase family protein [Sulfobacillus thermosulfidooxidans]
MELEDVLQKVQEQDIRFVRFLYCDNGGIIRGKSAYAPTLPARLSSGIGLTVAMQAMNSLDQLQAVDGMGPVGEVRLVPDLLTFQVLPYAPNTAAVLTVMTTLDGHPWDACPRSFLARMDQKAKAMGITIQASIENEFSLVQDDKPWDETLCFSSQGMLISQDFIDDLAKSLEQQGIILEQYYPELAHGQHEISVRHRPVMEAASQQLYIRETIRAVAKRHGLQVSFAPKPWLDQAGNGGHIHFSARDDEGNNLFYDPRDPYRLSILGYQFMAGILFHLPALLALTTPTVNSYQRLVPNAWSSSYACWGPDNREAPLRIASPIKTQEQQSVNVEFKPADLTSNPYLALGALIAAGLDGIAHKLDPKEPVLSNPDDIPASEREARGIIRLPASLDQALDHLAQDAVLQEAMGEMLVQSYLAVKRSEVAFYQNKSPEEIAAWHRFRY